MSNDSTVRFTFPAKVALDPQGFSRSIGSIAELLGHPKCFSGVNCLFEQFKDHIIREQFEALPQDPTPEPARQWPTVDVAASSQVLSNIDDVRRISEIVFGKLGCLPCTSGFDVRFRDTLRTIVINENFEATEFGRGM